MPHPKPNPLFVKKPGETTSQHMSRLRKEFPKKFGMQKGHKVVKKKFTSNDIAAAEKRGAEKALAELKASLPGPEKVSPVPAQAPLVVPAAAAPVAVPPAPAPAGLDDIMSPLKTPPATPDTAIFGASTPPPPKVDATSPGSPPVPPPEPPPGTPGASPTSSGPATEADGGKYGAMVWAMIVKLCVGIFGPGFEPMVIKDSQGHVIYDEGLEGVKVWVNYLASIGVKVFSPVVELWIFMGSYVGIRSGLIIAKFRKKKTAPTTAAPGTQPESKEPGAQPASPAAKAPAPAPPPPPTPTATPDAATGAVELDDEHFGAM